MFFRRQPQQLSSTLAFMLGRDEGRFYRLRESEVEPLRECLLWLRTKNPHLRVYYSTAERFGALYEKLQTVVPLGSKEARVRIQRTRRVESAVEATLDDTLGSESAVLVIVDPAELPRSWASVDALAEGIGEAEYRVSLDGPESGSPDETATTLPESEARSLQSSARSLRSMAKVTLGDRHLDAKLFPHLHQAGSGSLRAEEGSGGMQQYAKNRLLLLEHSFRRSPVWSFWMLERLIKNDLYFQERARKSRCAQTEQHASAPADGAEPAESRRGTKRSAAEALLPDGAAEPAATKDHYAELFGRVEPGHIPESGAWWRGRQTELMSISADREYGLMTGMVTSTQNDSSPELLAHARRGPCAVPADTEMFEYLLTRRAPGERRAKIQEDATAATLSFQRRTQALKRNFLARHKRTPLGVSIAIWDRTEAQTREALHSHILTWGKRRKITREGYVPRPPLPLRAAGAESQSSPSRPRQQMNKEDDVYYRTETARVLAELVRPVLADDGQPKREVLLWAFLLRAIQTHLYVHACTPLYCLKNRASCRFFFPWKEQPQQQYEGKTQSVALRRRNGS